MRVLYVHTDPLPSGMGGGVATVFTAQALAEAGCLTTLLMPDGGGEIVSALAHFGLPANPGFDVERPCPLRRGWGKFSFTSTRRYYRAVASRIQTFAQRNEADVVFVRALKLAAFLTADRQPGGISLDTGKSLRCPLPLIYEAHNWYGDLGRKWPDGEDHMELQKRRQESTQVPLENATIPRIDGLATVTKAMLSLYEPLLSPGMPRTTAPMGVEMPAVIPVPGREPRLVYLGQLHPHKGLEVVLRALGRLPPEVTLRIVGGPAWVDHWRGEAKSLGLGARVEFTGALPHAEVRRQLSNCRIGLLPLRDHFYNRYLTSPLKLGEYAAAGLAVVASRLPVIEERGSHGQHFFLVPPDDDAALAAGIATVLGNPELEARLRAGIASNLPDWSWRRRGEVLRALAEDVLSAQAARKSNVNRAD